ncbi:MAG: RAMP superfamily CRISPR-associated protein, partial [Pyrobaculum sp.]
AAAGSATLSEVFRNIDTDITDELVDKLVLKLMKQFIDTDIRPSAIRNAQGANLYDKVVNTYGDAVKDILEKLRVTPAACNPVVEGLACELPIRDYKKTYLKALAKALGVCEFLYPCPVCRTFGAPGYASKVVVTSAYPNGKLGKDYYVLTRRHVAIDRYTGAAAEGKLF